MTDAGRYHDDAKCACCGGPLECHRDAICEKCCPTSEYFDLCAAVEEAAEELRKGNP